MTQSRERTRTWPAKTLTRRNFIGLATAAGAGAACVAALGLAGCSGADDGEVVALVDTEDDRAATRRVRECAHGFGQVFRELRGALDLDVSRISLDLTKLFKSAKEPLCRPFHTLQYE